jgi:hypothetical protein
MNNLTEHILPSLKTYNSYLKVASSRFNLSLDECRDTFGLLTQGHWQMIFNGAKYIKKQDLTMYIDWVIKDKKLYIIEELEDGMVKTTFISDTDKETITDLVETKKLIIITI